MYCWQILKIDGFDEVGDMDCYLKKLQTVEGPTGRARRVRVVYKRLCGSAAHHMVDGRSERGAVTTRPDMEAEAHKQAAADAAAATADADAAKRALAQVEASGDPAAIAEATVIAKVVFAREAGAHKQAAAIAEADAAKHALVQADAAKHTLVLVGPQPVETRPNSTLPARRNNRRKTGVEEPPILGGWESLKNPTRVDYWDSQGNRRSRRALQTRFGSCLLDTP
jgi:hypothetical protein